MNSVVQWVSHFAHETPDKAAVIAEGKTLTYRELWDAVTALSSWFCSQGIKRGDRIIHSASSSVDFAVVCFGIHLCGAVSIPIEHSLKADGIDALAERLDASLICSEEHTAGGRPYLDLKELSGIIEQHIPAEPIVFPEPDELADILFTTGTTGASKGVMLTHRAVLAATENVVCGAEIGSDNVYLVPVPINHAGGIRKLYASMITGSTTVLLNGFVNVRKFYETIDSYGVTSILMPPSAIRMILTLSGDKLGEYDGKIRYIHTGSAAFPEADKEHLSRLLPNAKLIFAYGSSESGCVSMYDYNKNKGLVSCVGKPNINAVIHILDEKLQEIKASKDNPGIIAISGDMNMTGYYNDPERTALTKIGDMIVTSDLGYFDENGFLYMLGRKDDVINIGGLKIAPTEVEDAVLRFPGIAECACCAVTDRMGGNVPKLLLVMEKGCELDASELRAFLGKTLESFKIPKIMTVVDSIPRTSNGKIDRKRLS